ncbi:hypothetical protein CUR178_04733 [Leishmania enriettii]|uniref:Uncharacterized protein n=1 Tax=Leishmania enriettii TaxID=5663 RepID=A0A836H1N7_LEIEN|nr:hypothetical protein CUR178_04733 [Leishmania enriettii]
MSSMAAPRDASVLAALEQLEAMRERLHDNLREAAFSFTSAQREEERTRGCFVSFDAVPTVQGTLEPLVSLTRKSTNPSASGSEEALCGDSDEAALLGGSDFAWEMVLVKGEQIRKQRVQAAALLQASPTPDAAGEAASFPLDPIYYFSEHPSRALRECQEAYRRVLRSAVETVNAQQHALAAAAAMTTASAQVL